MASSTETVAQSLREKILSGELKPGGRVREVEIAKLLEVSRTPVREAFRILQSEGYLSHSLNSGVIVTRPTFEEISQLTEMRGVLEALSVRYAATRITPEELDELRRINHAIAEAGEHSEKEAARLDNRLHLLIAQASHNKALLDVLTDIHRKNSMIINLLPVLRERTLQTCKEHLDIIEAMAVGEEDIAVRYTEIHFQRGRESFLRKFTAYMEKNK